ncbi:MAG: hypothetical protein ACREI8_15300 [Myxococcota bacterium]
MEAGERLEGALAESGVGRLAEVGELCERLLLAIELDLGRAADLRVLRVVELVLLDVEVDVPRVGADLVALPEADERRAELLLEGNPRLRAE